MVWPVSQARAKRSAPSSPRGGEAGVGSPGEGSGRAAAAFAEIGADDVVFHEPYQDRRGRDGGQQRYRAFRDAFRDVAITLHEVA
jgi:hypothetical protein